MKTHLKERDMLVSHREMNTISVLMLKCQAGDKAET